MICLFSKFGKNKGELKSTFCNQAKMFNVFLKVNCFKMYKFVSIQCLIIDVQVRSMFDKIVFDP